MLELLQSSFETHAHRVAVEGSTWILTYRNLERESHRFALALRAAGVGPGHMVPMLMGRSPRFIVAMLAVLRCGAAYVPVDLLSPPARQAAMMDQLDSPVVLLDAETEARLIGNREAIDVAAALRRPIALEPLPWPDTPPQAPLYVMFTSGSTGTPKGVIVPHGGVARLVHDTHYAEFRADARWSQIASLAFDASTLEIWAPLLHGGCCVIQEIAMPSLDELASFLVDRRISDAWLTAALFNAIVDDRIEALGGLRQIATGGERVSPLHALRCLERWPALPIVNGYGPTENTTFSICHTVLRADVAELHNVPIGRPIRGTTARVMRRTEAGDEAGAAVDAVRGESGELWVGGAGVALGYLGEPALTQRKFVERDGDRWYRTGDLVRQREDGIFEFIGRADRQVKIQGHRIELDEVERILSNCPGVNDAIVAVQGDSAETRHLVGIYCGHDGPGPDTDTVRAWLAEHIAAGEMPHVLYPLASFPHNINGKVDRPALLKQLADGALGNPAAAAEGPVQWQSETEQQLAAIWSRCLPGARLERESNFTLSGGTSLMALRVASDVARLLGRSLAPLEVVRHPVLAELARVVDAAPAAGTEPAHGIAGHGGATLSRSQQSLVHAAGLDASGAAYLAHVAIAVDASIPDKALRKAFDALAQRHPMLRTTALLDGDRVEARVLDALPRDSWTSHGRLDAVPAGLDWPDAILAVINRKLDIAQDGPMRVDCWQLADGRSFVIWTVHHFAVDDSGIRQALADLDRILCEAELAPVYGSAFAFAAVERSGTDDAAVRAQAAEAVLALRGAVPPLPAAPRAGAEIAVALDAAVSRTLPAAAQRWGATPFTPIVVAYGLALQEVFGAPWRFILAPFSRRSEPELTEPVGFLLDVRLIEAGARDGESPQQTLARVHALLLEAQRPRFLPVDRLADAVSAIEPAARAALTQFAITWRLDPHGPIPFGGRPATVVPVPQAGARFGLTLHAESCDGKIAARIEAVQEAIADGRAAAVAQAFARHLDRLCAVDDAVELVSPATAEFQGARPAEAGVTALHRMQAEAAWVQWVGAPPQADGDNFLRSGGSSLLAMRLAASLRRSTGVTLDVSAFMAQPTFGRLCQLLAARPATASPAVTLIGTQNFERVMLIVPGARGGAVGMYRLAHELHRRLPETWAVAIADLQSIMERAPDEGRPWFFAQQLQQVVRDLGEARIAGIVGYSLGGLLGIDLLQLLDPQGTSQLPLWMIDTYAPVRMLQTRTAFVQRVAVSLLRHPVETATLIARRLLAKVNGSPDIVRDDQADSDGPRWRAFLNELARREVRAPTVSVTLIHSKIQARRSGLLRDRATNGFDPGRFGRFRTVEVDFDHDDLRREAAETVATLIVAERPA